MVEREVILWWSGVILAVSVPDEFVINTLKAGPFYEHTNLIVDDGCVFLHLYGEVSQIY